MLVFGHIGLTLGLARALHRQIDARWVAVASMLPDLIDKPLQYVIAPAFTHGNTRTVGHSLTVMLVCMVLVAFPLRRTIRAARVVAEITNGDGVWRPGSFVTAAIAVAEQSVPLAVPTSAIQTIGGDKVVFVRTAEGFEKRPVVLGRDDGRFTEIATGLKPGEIIAASNTFPLKAEFLKGQAQD